MCASPAVKSLGLSAGVCGSNQEVWQVCLLGSAVRAAVLKP